MSKQKFVVFLIAIIGMIATFLPWYEIGGLGMIMGYQTVGWFTFIMFALVFLFGLRKEAKQDMSMGLLYLGSFFSLLAAFSLSGHLPSCTKRMSMVDIWARVRLA